MAQLPLKLPFEETIQKWKAQLDPVLANNILQGQQLTNVALVSGDNNINHKLSRKMQGWFIVDINASASVFRSAPFNDSTLSLTSSAACTVNLWVY